MSRAPQHLYQRIKEQVLHEVREGRLKPGDPVPGDAELAERFGCARMTAHRALRELAEDGVIERRRRSGSRVARRSGRTALFDIPRIDLEVEATGASYRYQLLQRSKKRPDTLARERLELESGRTALWLRCLHFADVVPFQLEHRWINLDAAPEAAEQGFRDVGPNRWLLEHVPWSRAEHRISAELASQEAAEMLDVEPSAALLVLERRTFQAGRVVTWSRLVHPGDSYTLRSAITAPGATM